MAVEIPVVVNIDKAFQDAAKRVGIAIEPLRKSVDGLTEDLETWTSIMKDADINSDDWLIAAKNIQSISEALAQADYQLKRYTSNEGSIKQMSIDLAELNRRWEAMGASQKFGPDGKTLSDDAKKAVAQYKQITEELNRQGKTLQQIVAEETRLEKLRQKGIQSRRYENAILNTTAKTMRVLQEQERILSDRLSTTTIGSNKYNKLKVELEGVRRELAAINGESIQTESRMERLVKNSIRLVALHAAGTFLRNVREVTAEFELQRVALGSIIKDTERAEGLFRQIKAAAIESPFEIKDLVSYTKQLSAYQIETDKLFDTTMKLADVSAGLGVDMGRLILAYGQVRAAAVLRGQELRQFTEAGIPLVDKLAEKFKELRGDMVSTGEVFQLISERAVPFRMIEEIFNDMTSAGGMFYKMQEKQAKTLAGQWANLKDAVSIMYDEIGNTAVVHKAMESMISGVRSVMQNWRSWYNVINVVGTGLAAYLGIAKSIAAVTNLMAAAEKKAALAESAREKGMRKFVTSLVGKTAAEKISKVATDLHTAAMIRAMLATNGLSRAFWQLTAAMATNPFGITIALVGSLVALFSTLSDKTRDISKDIDNAEASIKSFNKTTKDTARLIDEYEELSEKEKLTAKEAAKLRDISRELGAIFPKTTEGINQQTGALTLNIEKLKEYNAEAEKAIRKGMEAQIRENEKTIKKNQREINRITKENTRGWGRNKSLGLLSPVLFPLSDAKMAENTEQMIKLEDDVEKLQKANLELRNTLDGVANSTKNASEETTKWQEKLIEFNSRIDKEGKTINVISPDQIKNYSKLSDALDDIAKKYIEYDEQEKKITASIEGKTGAEKEELQGILDRTTARKNLAKEELDYYNAFYLTQKKGGKDDRLQRLRSEISEITNAYKKFLELRKYMSDSQALSEIGILFPQLKGWEPSFEKTIEKLQDMRKKVVAQLAKSPNDKTLLEMQRTLDTEISNLKFDDLKKKFDSELKRIKDEIKRSETARSFYQDILGLTGDEELATSLSVSVYGGVGQDFKDRIKKELVDSLSTLDAETFAGLDDKIREAFDAGDYEYLVKNIEKVPEALRATVQQVAADAEKFSADQIRTWIKELAQFKTYGEKRVQLAKQTAQRIEEINASKLPKDQKDSLILEYQRKEAEEAAKLQYEAFKDTPMYIHLFENLDAASTRMLTSMRKNLNRLKENRKDLDPTQLREMQKRIEEIDSQLAAKNPFKAIADGIRAYREQTKGTSRVEIEKKAVTDQEYANEQKQILETLTAQYEAKKNSADATEKEKNAAKKAMEDQAVIADKAQETANASAQTAKNLEGSLKNIVNGAENVEKWTSAFSGLGSSVKNLLSEVLSDEDAEAFAEQFDGVMGVIDGLSKSGGGISKILKGDFTGVIDIVSGVVDSIASIFGASNAAKVRRANKTIEDQQKIIDNLERSYQKLSDAMDETFDNEYLYNYRKQLEIINAEVAAYRAQADAERSKGKKADSDKIEEYEQSATEAMERIKEITKEMQSFFAGSDLASAAQDFSSAWLDAYREFGNTAGAIEDRMEEMVKNLVEKAALSGIVQNIMGGWYESLKNIKDWNAQAIAEKVAEARALIPIINQGLNNAAAEFQAAGLSLRGTVGQFTGISRDYAAASEESINGLAAGVNTQNFFLQHLDMNVALILSALTGGASTAGASVTGEVVDPYKDQMLLYAGHLPAMDQNLAELLAEVRKVIKPRGTTATHYVATNM